MSLYQSRWPTTCSKLRRTKETERIALPVSRATLPPVAFNKRFDISYGNNRSLGGFPGRGRHEVNQVYPSKKKEA
jgi:hypothetical protein